MKTCHDLRLDQVYECPDCGLQVKVVKECHDVGKPVDECCDSEATCALKCCGKELILK